MKTLLFVVLLLASLSSPVFAQDRPDPFADRTTRHSNAFAAEPWSRDDKMAATAFVIASALDVSSTVRGLNRGALESNPLYGSHPSSERVVATKALVTIGALWYYDRHRTPATRRGLWIAAALLTGVAAANERKARP